MSKDEYYTHKKDVVIVNYIKPNSVVWCPADKEWSQVAEALREQGHTVICTHIDDGKDFLTYEPDFEFDYIITNPPYSIRKQWLLRCEEFGKPYAMLIPVVSLALKDFRMNAEGMQLILFSKRLKYWGNEAMTKNPPSETGWFCKGLEMSQQIILWEDNENDN